MGFEKARRFFEEYANGLKSENRFFVPEMVCSVFDEVLSEPTNIQIVPKGTPLYRARRNDMGKEFKWISDLGINRFSPGLNRASPKGIPYMYLAEDPETAIAEIRANVKDQVTVATYRTTQELRLVSLGSDATHSGGEGSKFDSLDVSGFMFLLSYAFSAPVKSQAEFDYLPCQYFAEYCKRSGFDGIRYVSCARGFHDFLSNQNHYNYVLFKDDKLEFHEATLNMINGINYDICECGKVHLMKKDEGEK